MTHQIITGSCLDPEIGLPSLADKSVDVCIADPQYEEEAHTKQRRQKIGDCSNGELVVAAPLNFAPMTDDERWAVCAQLARVVRSVTAIFCQAEGLHKWIAAGEDAGLKYRRAIPWIKPDAMPSLHGRWPGQSYETIALFLAVGARSCPVGGKARFYRHSRCQDKLHMTGKPIALMRDIVRDLVVPGESIIDPYAGSGTTIVAAKMLGHPATGWELDPAMAEKARRRIEGQPRVSTTGQGLLFG